MTVWWDCLAITLTFDSSPIKGEGDSVGCFVLLLAATLPLWIADQVRNDVVVVAGRVLSVSPPCGYWIKSSMTDRSGNDGRPTPHLWIADQVRNDVVVVAGSYSAWRCAPPCGYWIKSSMTDRSGMTAA